LREAIRLKPDYAAAHCNLGFTPRKLGRYAESLESFRRGHELGTKQPDWRHPSAQWVREAERLAALDRRLRDALDGKAPPKDAAELSELTDFCKSSRRPVAAIRVYAGAFQTDTKLADDLDAAHRYNAACFAARAAAGQGDDAKDLNDDERARWRSQALGWLRADLAAWEKRLEEKPADREEVEGKMRHWQKDAGLAAVRDADALPKLPDAERAAWDKLWRDVEALRQRATAPK
jgi:hypothetical protein